MKRCWFCVALVLAAGLVVGACTPRAAPAPPPAPAPAPAPAPPTSPEDAAWAKVVADAKKEGTLTVYSFYFVADIGRSIAQKFQDRYGIRVEILPASGRATVARIQVEQKTKQVIADIANSGVSSATELAISGLGDNVWKELPALRDKSVFVIDPVYSPGGEILFMNMYISGPLINTNLVKPQDEPKSWKDFLDPKWKGKISGTDPRGGGSDTFQWWTVSRYYKVLDDDYWRRLAPQMALFGGSAQENYRMIARGEYHTSLSSGVTGPASLIAEGAPLKRLAMEEGNNAQGESIMKVKGGPHPNAAKLFLNWLLSAEGQDVYGKAASVDALRKDVTSYLHPGAKIAPKKVFSRTWEVAEAGNEWFKAGLIEQFFGKK